MSDNRRGPSCCCAASGRLRIAVVVLLVALVPGAAQGAKIVLKSGIELEGDVAHLASMVVGPTASTAGNESIAYVDDGLTRTYFTLKSVSKVIDNVGEAQQEIKVPQPVANGGRRMVSLGNYVGEPGPLDGFGRRGCKIMLSDGLVEMVQGVTLVTPRYYKLQTLRTGGGSVLLDQRFATSNLPSPLLAKILDYALKNSKPDARLTIVRLYMQADRFVDARRELESLTKKQPSLKGLPGMLDDLKQLEAQTVLRELELRRRSGQHQLVRAVLDKFPTDGVAGATLFQVRELLKQYLQSDKLLVTLKGELKQRLSEVKNTTARDQLAPLVDEIVAELNLTNLERLSAYRRLSGDAALLPEEKLSLAVSGWLLGTNDATNKLSSAVSMARVRAYVIEYLNDPIKTRREHFAEQIASQEGGTPLLLSQMLAAMKPPYPLPAPVTGVAGYYELTVPGRDKQPDATYYVQLPPEYDPYRRYPAILTLHGSNTTGPKQIDWWAGMVDPHGQRRGQAGRNGYIVIAPQWGQEGQEQYQYSAREHGLVLDVLRDACRRFSIDMDRVFLTGHGTGGDAAWDMGFAHPDQWAGVMPIVATADTGKYKYCRLYWENGRRPPGNPRGDEKPREPLPLYFVGGELDGQKMAKNAPLFDRYLQMSGFNATVVEFQGRGHESFSDEILRLFDWMGRQRRQFFPKHFEAVTMRSFDNYFWWVEINRFLPGMVVDPEDWTGRNHVLPISGSIRGVNGLTTVHASTGRGATTIWLSPELVNFAQRLRVEVDGRAPVNGPQPSVSVMLEDARSRGDRQHPFWARVDFP